mgnify:CR=1 FL=1
MYQGIEPSSKWLNPGDVCFDCYMGCDGKCCYSDDTEMTVLLMESMLECNGFNEDCFADKLRHEASIHDFRRGYGYTMSIVVSMLRKGIDWKKASKQIFNGQGSYGNGAAIRVAPIAIVAKDVSEVIEFARRQATITHSHPLGVEGAILIALAQYLVLREKVEPETIVDRLLEVHKWSDEYKRRLKLVPELIDKDPYKVAYTLGNDAAAHRSTVTAVYIYVKARGDLEKTITYAISIGGDTDSIASMATSLTGAYIGYKNIPQYLVDKVEDIDKIKQLAIRLYNNLR